MGFLPTRLNYGLFRKGYIYALICPRTNLVRYVGKSFNLKSRFSSHCNPLKKEINKKSNWVRGLKKEGLLPIIEIIDDCDEFNWGEKEKQFIKIYKSLGANLLNMTSGGEAGMLNGTVTVSHRDKLSKSLTGKVKSKTHIENAKNALNLKYAINDEYRISFIERAKKTLSNLTNEQKEKAKSKRFLAHQKRAKIKLCDFVKIKAKLDSKKYTQVVIAKEYGVDRKSIYCAYKKFIK